MKILTQRKPLLEGLDLVKEAVSKHAALPILKDVKITAEGESLYLYTTNLTTGIKTRVKEANVIEPGIALCDTLKLLSIVKELPDHEIILSKEENSHLRVECDNVSFKLIGLSEEDFPNEIIPDTEAGIPVGEEFFKAVAKVKHAASKEDSRYNLNGLYFDKDIVATDGHRLSLVKNGHSIKNMLVPLEFIPALLRTRRNGSNIQLCRSENSILICSEDTTLHCRLIDGEFPDYEQVLPQTFERKATMDRSKLHHAIKRILLMSDKSNQIRFEFSGDRVILTSANPDAGEAREELDLVHYEFPASDQSPFIIGFAGKYILDVLEVLENDQVTFLMNDPGQALRIEEKDSTHIVMPVRLL